jgi:hypothetical protein
MRKILRFSRILVVLVALVVGWLVGWWWQKAEVTKAYYEGIDYGMELQREVF